jgi:hypothetical protein
MLTILKEAYNTVEEPLLESVKESPKRSSTASKANKVKESANVASGSRMPKRRKVDV